MKNDTRDTDRCSRLVLSSKQVPCPHQYRRPAASRRLGLSRNSPRVLSCTITTDRRSPVVCAQMLEKHFLKLMSMMASAMLPHHLQSRSASTGRIELVPCTVRAMVTSQGFATALLIATLISSFSVPNRGWSVSRWHCDRDAGHRFIDLGSPSP
jgi:hypothetical protein